MWNLISSNKLCSERATFQAHQRHVKNVVRVKPSINNLPPEIPSFLRSRAKQEKMKETRAATIQYENRVLLDKMMDIEKKKTDLNPDTIAKKTHNNGKTLNTNKRVRELRKINDENKALLRRLQSAHSVYSIDKWIEGDRKNKEIRSMISQNARRSQHNDYSGQPKFSKTFYGSEAQEPSQTGYQSGMYYEY